MAESLFENNVEAIAAWNGVLFDKFARFRELLTKGLGIHGEALMDRCAVQRGARVIDLGCGFGDTTLELAARVGPEGEAVGVDAAERFIESCRKDAAALAVRNVRFEVGDVQSADLGGPYDLAFSRFGMMVLASPVAALRNIKKALRPGGTLAMVVWRKKEENAFLFEVERRVLDIIPHPDKGDQVTCGPGPFSMSSPDLVSSQLRAAGFSRIAFERFDADIKVGANVDDAIEFAMQLGPAGEVLRLAGASAEPKRPEILAALRELLQSAETPRGVFGGSSTWLVTARA